jgi:hypothetical protein
MRRLAVAVLSVLARVGLTGAPVRAESPTFFFEKGYDGVAFWQSQTATERTTSAS